MTNYKDSASRARETATFRFTAYEKQLLAHLAELQGMTQTALIRALLAERADTLGVMELPEPPPKRKPGRPKKIIAVQEMDTELDDKLALEDLDISERVYAAANVEKHTFGTLIVQFQEAFRIRGEKMQHELESTIRFVTGITGEEVLIPPQWLLSDIDALLLQDVRERIKHAELRFPQKNLHLTYLRMMFNYAVKEGLLAEECRPIDTLRSFTAKEVADAFPLPIKTI
ncbi:MAG: hypothetical protein JXR76_28190 [Deltaproteobacteria bacterium]|nr:hypothetical protein [Deltaproteobacteria bacterium]